LPNFLLLLWWSLPRYQGKLLIDFMPLLMAVPYENTGKPIVKFLASVMVVLIKIPGETVLCQICDFCYDGPYQDMYQGKTIVKFLGSLLWWSLSRYQVKLVKFLASAMMVLIKIPGKTIVKFLASAMLVLVKIQGEATAKLLASAMNLLVGQYLASETAS
jgi:hypothetical protein